jgi:hypothetical protein
MKKIAKYILVALAPALLLSSCMQEVTPLNGSATESQVMNSPLALQALTAAIPTAMYLPGSYNSSLHCDFGYPAIRMITDAMLEEKIIVGDNTGYDWFGPWATGRSQGDGYAYAQYFWYFYYKWIKNTNDLIRMINDMEVANGGLDADQKSYLGIAYTYRALYYLDLVRLYEFKPNNYTSKPEVEGLSCVLALETETMEGARENGRAKVEDVYAQIFADLAKAEELLAGYKRTSIAMPDLSVVYGLYAKAYLEFGEKDNTAFAKAADYARKAVAQGKYSALTQKQWEDPINGFNTHSSNSSWMWALTTSSENIGNLHNFYAHASQEGSWGYTPLSMPAVLSSFFDRISDADFRKHSWIDPDREYAYQSCYPNAEEYIASLRDHVSIKFRPYQGDTEDYAVGNVGEINMMRMEEMLFIEAEAEGRANLENGKALLKAIMDKRILDGSYVCAATDFATFQEELIFQKRVEFWGEGVVMFDCKRANIGMTRGYVGTNAPATYCLNTEGRSPFWNIVITQQETNNNLQIPTTINNPDPTGSVDLWIAPAE